MFALAIPLALLILSFWLIRSPEGMRRDIGKSLLTGAIVAFAVFALQLHLDDKRRSQEKREQFRLSVAFAENLKGLKPEFSLAGMYLSGKVLDNAELSGEDLSGVNLQGSSLRNADLTDADLTLANLYGADLTEADLIGADLSGADLRGTQFIRATVDLPPDPDKLDGSVVNSETCWAEDFLANVHLPASKELRDALERDESLFKGRTVIESSSPRAWGRACVVDDVNIWDALGLYAPRPDLAIVRPDQLRQSVQRLAMTFGRGVESILGRFDDGRRFSSFTSLAPTIPRRLCSGSTLIPGHVGSLTPQGFALLLVRRPGQDPGEAMVIRQPEGSPGEPYKVLFRQPLEAGTVVSLVVEEPDGVDLERFVMRRRVQPCLN
ncbi:MAG TPA: pentapeptide repeat-containing protein [Solirubrobacterales bacterium]|nr:pentapeptide repeat-containing protein [Solirubrobacterales bacterium]